MRLFTTTLLALTMSSACFSQGNSERFKPRHNLRENQAIERYGIDYEVKDFVVVDGDSSILFLIDLMNLETFRSSSSDVEVLDQTTGLTVILYKERKARLETQTIFIED